MAAKERKSVLVRLDPEVHEALSRWAADELRSANAQIEFLLRRALGQAGRLPKGVRADASALPKRGRPPKDPQPSPGEGGVDDTETEE
jgi:hypothetical protein